MKINERQLKNIVNKSVRRVISELDWKTLRNAQEKNRDREEEYSRKWDELEDQIEAAEERGDTATAEKLRKKQQAFTGKKLRTLDFGFASDKAFNDTFFGRSHDRFNAENGENMAPFKGTDDGSYSTPEPWVDGDGNIHKGHYFDGHGKVDGKNFDDTISYIDGVQNHGGEELNGKDSDAYSDDKLKSFGLSGDEINDVEKARREIRRYRNGEYGYSPEKGWHLKESKAGSIQNIVNRSVRKVLNESQSGSPIRVWNYFCANYPYDFIEQAWADSPNMAQHLKGKFMAYYDAVGSYGVMNKFYLNLDGNNQQILEDYVMNVYARR